MALLNVPYDQIDETRLRALVAAGAAESRTIDYKRESYGNAHSDLSEWLADLSSFANTSGGDLLLGMDAANGIPSAITPLTMPMDPEILRLEQCARGGLQPRITNLAFHPIPITGGGHVLLVRAPRSFNPPHRIIRQGSNRFWARSAAGKYEPDVNELRALFTSGPQLAERIRNFRLDRVAKIAAGEAPVQLMDRGIVTLHVVPLSAFDVSSASVPLRQVMKDYHTFLPFGSQSWTGSRITFEGVLQTSNADQQAAQHRAYLQLYRNGIVETLDSTVTARSSGTPIISMLDDKLIRETGRALRDLVGIGIEPPYAVFVSLLEVKGARIHLVRDASDPSWYDHLSRPLDKDQYHFDEVIVETAPTNTTECANVMRPILDQLANAGGQPVSPVFDANGDFVPLKQR